MKIVPVSAKEIFDNSINRIEWFLVDLAEEIDICEQHWLKLKTEKKEKNGVVKKMGKR